MKIRNIIILFLTFVSLSHCKKNDTEEPYSNEEIIRDNAKAAVYYHVVFREVENAWAFIHDKKYQSGTYVEEITPTIFKKITYDKENTNKELIVEYNAWQSNDLLLGGELRLRIEAGAYRENGMIAIVYLTDFAINGQLISGEPSLKYITREDGNDQYTYTVGRGAIYEEGNSKTTLISCNISGGQYVRVEGDETLSQKDDVWTYTGTMKGILHEDPNLEYTNTVLTRYTTDNGESNDGTIYFNPSCPFAQQGVSQIKLTKRPDSEIVYGYDCSEIYYVSVKNID